MDRVDALTKFIRGVVQDPTTGLPTARHFTGTWIAAESADANLSQVYLPGGHVARFVPKVASVSGLAAGNIVALVSVPGGTTYIIGKLVGDVTLATPVTADTAAPSAPGSLATGATTTSTVALSWAASSDNVGVVAYDVYVNGTFSMTTVTTSANVTGLANNTTYTFGVRARDAAGNVSVTSTVSGGTTAPSAPPAGTTFVLSYAATWSRSFNYNGRGEYDSWYGNSAFQGRYGGGNLESMIGFNTGQIQSDLAGAQSYVSASIKLTYAHWYWNAGGIAIIGVHNNSSPPGSFVNTTPNLVQSGGWAAGVTRTVQLPSNICGGFASGGASGVTLGPGPSTDLNYYGNAYGAGSGVYQPILTLTFVR